MVYGKDFPSWESMHIDTKAAYEASFNGLVEERSRAIEPKRDFKKGISSDALGFFVINRAGIYEPRFNAIEFRLGSWTLPHRGNRTHNAISLVIAEDLDEYKADPLRAAKQIAGGKGFRQLRDGSDANGYFTAEGDADNDSHLVTGAAMHEVDEFIKKTAALRQPVDVTEVLSPSLVYKDKILLG